MSSPDTHVLLIILVILYYKLMLLCITVLYLITCPVIVNNCKLYLVYQSHSSACIMLSNKAQIDTEFSKNKCFLSV